MQPAAAFVGAGSAFLELAAIWKSTAEPAEAPGSPHPVTTSGQVGAGSTPDQLSGGQQPRVACARALVGRPEVVFADEPTGNLDSRAGAEVLSFLGRSVRELGQTIIMVTHDPVAASYADRVAFLTDGEIVDELTAPTADAVLDRGVVGDLAARSDQSSSARRRGRPDRGPGHLRSWSWMPLPDSVRPGQKAARHRRVTGPG